MPAPARAGKRERKRVALHLEAIISDDSQSLFAQGLGTSILATRAGRRARARLLARARRCLAPFVGEPTLLDR